MEAHKGILMRIRELALNGFLEHIRRHGVVDIQQRDGILAHAGPDKLGQAAIDIHFAGHGNAHACETAVHIAGNKAKLGLEGRPAFSRNGHKLPASLVSLYPV